MAVAVVVGTAVVVGETATKTTKLQQDSKGHHYGGPFFLHPMIQTTIIQSWASWP